MQSLHMGAPAKVNLSLDIVGARPDGYHLLEMVMQSVSLEDRLVMTPTDQEEFRLSCSEKDVPLDKRNIVWKVCDAFFAKTKIAQTGLHIFIQKNIPSMAGLAGGSADGAAALIGLNRLYHAHLSDEELCDIGALVGADIPFCIKGGTAFVEGIGEIITPLPVLHHGRILIVKPPIGINTAKSFQQYDRLKPSYHPNTAKLIEAVRQGDFEAAAGYMGNVLQKMQPIEPVEALISEMSTLGAAGSVMTGSGSAVIGLFPDPQEAVLAFAHFKERYPQTFLTVPINHGAYFLQESCSL